MRFAGICSFICICAASLLMLTGCAGSDGSSVGGQSEQDTQSSASESIGTDGSSSSADNTAKAVGSLPRIDIETVSKEEGAMDFVTKPTNRYVAKEMSKWTPGYKIPPEPYYEACTVTVTDTDGSVSVSGSPAQVKVRGNWTTKNDKKPLRIKFDEKQPMLSLNGGAEMKNWLLLAEYKDKSMLRNKTALQIARELYADDGLYAADSCFAEVTVNGEYWGMYLVTEQQQINSSRVDITEAEKDYTGTDIGYFMEYDGYYFLEDELNQFLLNYNSNAELVPYDGEGGKGRTQKPLNPSSLVGISIKSDIYSKEQHDFIASYMNNVYKIMYEAAYNDKAYAFNDSFTEIAEAAGTTPEEAVRAVVDVQSLADAYIIAELACDADVYWSSFFMDADFGPEGEKKLVFEAPWDYDSAFGNKDRCATGEGFYCANIVNDVNDNYKTINPWLAVLMYEDWFTDIIRDKWTAAYDSGIFTRASEMIEKDSTELAAEFERNYERWDNIFHNADAGEWSYLSAVTKNEKEAADHLNDWLRARVEFLNEHWHK